VLSSASQRPWLLFRRPVADNKYGIHCMKCRLNANLRLLWQAYAVNECLWFLDYVACTVRPAEGFLL